MQQRVLPAPSVLTRLLPLLLLTQLVVSAPPPTIPATTITTVDNIITIQCDGRRRTSGVLVCPSIDVRPDTLGIHVELTK